MRRLCATLVPHTRCWGFRNMYHGAGFEEQTLPHFHQKRFFPVRIGHLLNSRYRIIAKLGYGAYSTVWLAKDERSKQYSSLKVCIQDDAETSPILNEVQMLRRLRNCAEHDEHPGLPFTRLADDIFKIDGPLGSHYCIAAKPQGCSLWVLKQMFPDGRLPKELIADLVHRLLLSINFLHATCNVIHTDISTQNVLLQPAGEDSFRKIEEQESQNPSVPIRSGNHIVYESRGAPSSLFDVSERPVLTDFGSMRLADPINRGWSMPDTYRAPEVLLALPWDFPVDLWSVGVLILELLEGRNLFDPIDRATSQYVLPWALTQYIGYLGAPPLAMIKQSGNPIISTFFDDAGNWICEHPIPETSLEEFVTAIPPGAEKTMFLKFIRRMLTWDEESRASANELLEDDWFMAPAQNRSPE